MDWKFWNTCVLHIRDHNTTMHKNNKAKLDQQQPSLSPTCIEPKKRGSYYPSIIDWSWDIFRVLCIIKIIVQFYMDIFFLLRGKKRTEMHHTSTFGTSWRMRLFARTPDKLFQLVSSIFLMKNGFSMSTFCRIINNINEAIFYLSNHI